ncbi:MAG: transcription termination factor Rho [Acidimicrobiales bacterium]
MSDPVLERSVLERKERDELQLIARAMGASPTSRTRKADLVDMILTTAGIITVDSNTHDGNGSVSPAPATKRPYNGRSSTPLVGNSSEESPSSESRDTVTADTSEVSEATQSTTASESTPASESTTAESTATQGLETSPMEETTTTVSSSSSEGVTSDQTAEVVPTHAELSGGSSATSTVASTSSGTGSSGTSSGNANNGAARRGPNGQRGPGGGDRPRQDRPGQDRPGPRNDGPRNDEDGDPANRRRRRRGRNDQRPERSDQRPDRDRGEQRPDEQWSGEPVVCEGLLDLRDDGYGFLRTKGYLASSDDVYVSVKQTRQFGLRKGDYLVGASRPALRNEKNPALLRIDKVNDKDPEEIKTRPRFENLTPLFPDDKLRLETPSDPSNMTARIIDLISPIGKGQRGLIVSPPKAGKTTIMKQIVKSIEANNPDVHLMVLLVDERPEEVTDMRRSTRGEVIASTFDRPADEHTSVAELTIERAKRLVEDGRDVVIVLDGITRLARAYNLAAPATGRIMSGGIDSGALYPPKKFFGSARNIEEGGSLTILATALIETGSKMDEVIFEEFKGTGNMELRLDRRLAERRIYPAIDVDASSTRHEELLFDRKQLQQVWRVRRALNALSSEGASPSAALERLMDGMKTFSSNDEFLAEAAKA